MKKFFLFVFILVDLAVLGASVLFLMIHLNPNQVQLPKFLSSVIPNVATSFSAGSLMAVSSATVAVSSDTTPAAPVVMTPAPSNGRKILFAYRNAKAHKVMIRADFTGWKEEAMQKDATHVWKYTAILEPGEYAYCFSVDDKKPIKDPFNKRTKKVGTTFVSSILVGPSAAPSR